MMVVMLSEYFSIESWVYSVNSRGLSTQLWGAPVFSTKEEEVWLPITTCTRCFSLITHF